MPDNKPLTFCVTLLAVMLLAYILVIAKALLIPFIVALFVWHLLNTIASSIAKIRGIGQYIPSWMRMLLALFLLFLFCWGLITILTNNVTEVINAAPRYQARLMQLLSDLDSYFHIKILTSAQEFARALNIQTMLINVYGMFTSIMGNAVLILLYIFFLFLEQSMLPRKMEAFFPQRKHLTLMTHILKQIIKDTQTYLGIKTVSSICTSVLSFLIMKWVGLDFAEFWALLIFFLNYIPNIGSIIATIFPALLALIQFDAWAPFVTVTLGITTVQFVFGSFFEPKMMGRSLNLSPLVILIALGVWGSLWGIIGMFFAVPITVMMMIIFSHFEKTRGIAILLSQNGALKITSYEL